MQIKHPVYFGQVLHKRGFRDWFLYMFRHIEKRTFIQEPLHDKLLQTYQKIYDGLTPRQNINLPPRSAKTTTAKYFLAYCFAANLKCNFIYTSFSQSLLHDISRELGLLMQHPYYREMYVTNAQVESIESKPIDKFWEKYLVDTYGRDKETFSNKRIITTGGGIALFASVGSAITGFGAGVRGAEKFSGILFIDDGNKPDDIHSKVLREKAKRYFSGTLFTRLNNSNTPIANIQQRLHVDDLTGFLISVYNFETLAMPLEIDGACQLPDQYTPGRIAELKKDLFVWMSQYQQEPMPATGGLFKREDWKYWKILPPLDYRIITADTAQKKEEKHDHSVFQCWGISRDKEAFLIDQVRCKLEAPELEITFPAFWNKHKNANSSVLRSAYVEDKASGTGLIQKIERKDKIPIKGLKANKDKVSRANDIIGYIRSGYVYLPEDAPWLTDYLEELSAFDKIPNDDQVDCTVHALDVLYNKVKEIYSGSV